MDFVVSKLSPARKADKDKIPVQSLRDKVEKGRGRAGRVSFVRRYFELFELRFKVC